MPGVSRSRALFIVIGLWVGCGSRTDVRRSVDEATQPATSPERCNGLDDDGKNGVDDPFRDGKGRYVTDEHCGACGSVCAPRNQAELVTHCGLIDEVPRCIAERCANGFGPTREGRCAGLDERLCLACANDNDCGGLIGARCANIGGEARCAIDCAAGCPSGYACVGTLCIPQGGSCSCTSGRDFELACALGERDAGAPLCVGRASCKSGVLSACQVSVEVCDHDDNDCDGLVDEGFVDRRGAYSVDQRNCGECGVSCLEDTGLELELACGGDPYAPTCTLACPDARDGTTVGDLLDGDLDVSTGCECKVSALRDEPGPLRARDAELDVNCDGADGEVVASFYVATDGDDSYAGSPTRPLRTIGAALMRARASLGTPLPRPHVYVAGGVYAETVELADGVQVHGGYRRDFRALDPSAFSSELRAPANTTAPGGAALLGREVGTTPTLVEGMVVRGLDATAPGREAIGIYLEGPGSNLTLRSLYVRAGLPGEGATGMDGPAGAGPTTAAREGGAPRAAREQGVTHTCVRADAANTVRGGAAGASACGGVSAQGGAGGDAVCPTFADFQGAGERGAGSLGGDGGSGGQDSRGPITGAEGGCPGAVCCGLADFSVPTNFAGPRPGENGRDGRVGIAGVGCSDSRGAFRNGAWSGNQGSDGQAGQPGGGGGGGGAGGGVVMNFVTGTCEFPDGIGGGGGGGGAGGCGGGAGVAGSSGAPSVGLVVVNPSAFTIDDVSFVPSAGGRGGPGGAGGDGGLGGVGAVGGNISPALRTTPTLAGTYPGARGGTGGTGGAGGGGGGGCGGSSVGIWIVGAEPSTGPLWRTRNVFQLGGGGGGGAGGGGALTGSRGRDGEAVDVVVQR